MDLSGNYLVAGKGFYNIKVVNANNEDTHNGVTFEAKIPQITNNTSDVGAVHYSSARGFEYIKANKFSTADSTAQFTLKDTSPIMYLVFYKTAAQGSQYTPAKTGIEGAPVANNTMKLVGSGLAVCVLAAVAATKKKKDK